MRLSFLLGILLLAACARSAPTSYYLLESEARPVAVDSLPAKTLGLARPVLPEYLDRHGIVSRVDGQTRLVVGEFNVWAEPLGQGIRRVMREELAPSLLALGVTVRDAGEEDADVALFLDVLRFDGALGGTAYLQARWTLKDRRGKILAQGLEASEEPVLGMSYTDLTRSQSRLVCRFAARLAGLLPTLLQKEKK
ncbi:MAG: PqiC family protein [Desulfovibrio sp.]|jgi:uncharacterized lipoprotein YmbA|nr:PqiC family protein [Desulfovibrio sp.]